MLSAARCGARSMPQRLRLSHPHPTATLRTPSLRAAAARFPYNTVEDALEWGTDVAHGERRTVVVALDMEW